MLNFVLCDDNVSILNRLYKMLDSLFIKDNIDASIVFSSTSAEEILDFTSKNKIDVLILDINLNSNITGCDIAQIVRKKNKDVYIIFTTGHLEYALIAYKYKTFDYLPKPIVPEKLESTILRLIEDVNSSPTKFLKLDNNKTIIKEDDINYIKRDGMKLVFCTSSREYETYSSFSKILTCLPVNFVRCHKSYIANIKNITDVRLSENIIYFSPGCFCYIGAKYKKDFLEVLKNGNFKNNLECVNH